MHAPDNGNAPQGNAPQPELVEWIERREGCAAIVWHLAPDDPRIVAQRAAQREDGGTNGQAEPQGLAPTRDGQSNGQRIISTPINRHATTNGTPRLYLPDVAGLTLAQAALVYAKAGWFVLPTNPHDIKNPGSVVRGKWHEQSSRDPEQINRWWTANPDYGIALHIGRSGAVGFDFDADNLTIIEDDGRADIAAALSAAKAVMGTRREGDRGHYIFAAADAASLSNSAGDFIQWGEVRGKNGVLIAAPTPHPDADTKGGRYHQRKTGVLSEIPNVLRELLRKAVDEAEPLTSGEFEQFLAAHPGSGCGAAGCKHTINGPLKKFRTHVDAGASRQTSMCSIFPWAFAESVGGCTNARESFNTLWTEYKAQFPREHDSNQRIVGLPDEFLRLARWAAAQAVKDGPGRAHRNDKKKDNLMGVIQQLAPNVWKIDPQQAQKLNGHETAGENLVDTDSYKKDVAKKKYDISIVEDAKREIKEEQAQKLLDTNSQQAMDGVAFLESAENKPPIWGVGDQALWAPGQGTMIFGTDGTGKSTIMQQMLFARIGLNGKNVLGFPVEQSDQPILYLALDRPEQIRRSIARMVDLTNPAVRDRLKQKLIVWRGHLPFNCDENPELFADWVMQIGGDDLGLVIGDSVKDMVSRCTEDGPGMGFNDAVQRVTEGYGVEFGCCHHNRKENAQNTKPRKLGDVYGSRWLTAGLGSVLNIWRADEKVRELTQLKTPYGAEISPLEYEDDYSTGTSTKAVEITDALVTELAHAGAVGLTEQEAVEAVYKVKKAEDNEYTAHRMKVRRVLNTLCVESPDIYEYTLGTRANKERRIWCIK